MKQPFLTFKQLREANVLRLPEFKNNNGRIAHTEPDGSDWSLGEWMCALVGEVGEAANLIKKIRRDDVRLEDVRADLADELADIQIYLDLLAFRAGIDLGQATIDKFNKKSFQVGCEVWL